MTRKLLSLLVVAGMGAFVATAHACDKDAKKAKAEAKTPCGGAKATLTAATEDGRSEASEDKGGCPHAAKVKAEKKSGCSHAAKVKAEEKSGCGHSAKAKLTSADSEEKSGCSHAAKAKAEEKSGCSGSAKAKLASGECCGGKKDCCSEGKKADADGCPLKKKVDAILTSLPSIKYKAGNEVTGCAKSAAKLAKSNGGKIQYVVGDDVFDDEGEAYAKLANVLENEVESMTAVQYAVGDECVRCPMTAKKLAEKSDTKMTYRVAGFDFECKEKAEKAAKAVKAAIEEVHLAYKVGDETVHCSDKAGKMAKKNGGKIVYVVGDEETTCAQSAQIKLAQTKIRTAVETAARISAS